MISTKPAPLLQTDRVLLRLLQPADYALLLPYAINEPNLWCYSPGPIAGEIPFRQYIDLACQQYESGEGLPFVVIDKASGEAAGSTRFYAINTSANTVELGYTWYGRRFQGTGLNAHCKWLLLQLAFDTWQVDRVELKADARNERSIAAMKKIGCTVEGILRSHVPSNLGGRRDSIVLSILATEWQQRVKQHLQTLL